MFEFDLPGNREKRILIMLTVVVVTLVAGGIVLLQDKPVWGPVNPIIKEELSILKIVEKGIG